MTFDPRRRLVGAACLLLLIAWCSASGCGGLRYNSLSEFTAPDGASGPEARAARVLDAMTASNDEVRVEVGRALRRLPDLGDGVTASEAAALAAVDGLVLAGGPAVRRRLAKLAAINPDDDQYSGPLQGLFWMVQAEGPAVDPNDLTAEGLLDYAFGALPDRLTNPEAVLRYLATQYSYRLNLRDAQSKRSFFSQKYGDCTEFTLLAGWLVAGQGRQTLVLLTRPTPISAHVSLIYKGRDGYYLLDGSRTAIARSLRRDRPWVMSPVDAYVFAETEEFTGVKGPADAPGDLARYYDHEDGSPVSHKIVSFDEFEGYIEKNGRENPAWYRDL